jgi:hypothetical protein
MKPCDHGRLSALVFAGAFVITGSLQAPLCLADPRQPAEDNNTLAQEKTDQGLGFVQKENYPAALDAFEEAYRLDPTPKRLYNIAMCQKALYRYVDSIAAFRQFLKQGGNDITADLRQDAQNAIREMEHLIGKLKLKGAPDGVKVLIDGKEVAETPLAGPILLDPGEHTLEVTGVLRRELVIKSGSDSEVVVLAPSTDAQTRDRTLRKMGWIGIGTGGAALIAGVITGSLALNLNTGLKDAGCAASSGCDESKYGADHEKRDDLATTTNVLLGVGGAVAVAGGVLLFLSYRGEQNVESKIAVSPVAGASMAGFAVNGRF